MFINGTLGRQMRNSEQIYILFYIYFNFSRTTFKQSELNHMERINLDQQYLIISIWANNVLQYMGERNYRQ